jgi:hypothetical protein
VSQAKIEIVKEDNKTYYSHKRAYIGGKKIETPLKAISRYSKSVPVRITNSMIEIYKPFTRDHLTQLITQGDKQIEFNRNLRKQINLFSCGFHLQQTPMVLIPELKQPDIPEKELSFLLSTQSIFDLYVLPTANINSSDDIQKYIYTIRGYLNLINTVEIKKPLAGVVLMKLPRHQLEDLLNEYNSYEMAMLIMDFGGRVPFSAYQNIFYLQNWIKKKGINILTYGINVNIGKPSKGADAILAKDVLSIGLGLDVLGDNHVRKAWGNKLETLRIFVRQEYSYRKVNSSNIDKFYPKDTQIPKEVLIKEKNKNKRMDVQRAFNYEQISLEAAMIRRKIDDGDIVNYISRKDYVRKESILLETLTRKTLGDLSYSF